MQELTVHVLDQQIVYLRLLRATDLSDLDAETSLASLSHYKPEIRQVEFFKAELSPGQQQVWQCLMESTSFFELITGLFGTGKTNFLAFLELNLALLGKKVFICTSSNTALDAVGGKIESFDP